MERRALTTREDFDYWIDYMDDALEQFTASLPEKMRSKMDLSPASLDTLEAWLLERYSRVGDALASSEAAIVVGAARYVGETLRILWCARWDITLDNPRMAYFGLPVVVKDDKSEACPHTLVTACLDRRTGANIRGVVEALCGK